MLPNIRLIFVFAQLLVVCLSQQNYEGSEKMFKILFGRPNGYTTIAPNPTVKSLTLPPYSLQPPTASPTCQNICGQYPKLTTSCQSIPGQYQTTPEGSQTTIEPSTEEFVGYEYSNQTGHWYKFHAGPVVNWTDAREACKSEGADLAVPNSDTEAKVIMGLHARYLYAEITDTERQDWVAVGIFWENGTWKTVDGQFLEKSGYSRGLTGDNGDPTYCHGVMNRGGKLAPTGTMLYPFVCEKETAPLEVTINYQ